MRAIAIIVARGGSKRIPRKNVREFAGKPMIVRPIAAALESRMFDRVIVSTDDPEIASVATSAGVQAPFVRPAELADDHSGTLEVMTHAVDWARSQGWRFNRACCLYGTAAFVTPEDLAAARYRLSGWNYVFAAGRFRRSPQRAFIKSDAGAMQLLQPEFAHCRSQDLAPTYYDAGQFYWGTAEAWIDRRPIYGERTTFVELPPERALDIDMPDDWAAAERQFAEWKQHR
jgi:N-acylneuraminate cytidylyltransferase